MKSTLLLLTFFLLMTAGCQKNAPNTATNGYKTISGKAFQKAVAENEIKLSSDATEYLSKLQEQGKLQNNLAPVTTLSTHSFISNKTLLVEMPVGLVGQTYIFGGVITKVSDHENTALGGLKLSSLDPYHVRTIVVGATNGNPQLVFMGCSENCTETSLLNSMLSVPIVGVDQIKGTIVVDLTPIGQGLNLIGRIYPDSPDAELKLKTSETTNFEYSLSTLIFDIDSTMIAQADDANNPKAPTTVLTSRWYLKLNSVSDPYFVPRSATNGVGFFMTARAADPKIKRFALTNFNGSAIKYYIKNVPQEYQAPFAAAFDDWNEKLFPIFGKKLLEYEFVASSDPRNETIVAGDIRYNVLEWDLVNKAGYGGLGPSIANQVTGETFSANVLIQGPTILKLYKDWFKVTDQIKMLQAQGKTIEADDLLRQMRRSHDLTLDRAASNLNFAFSKELIFKVPSQAPELHDSIMQRNDFEDIPTNVTFETYMPGYFQDMVSHELGHNLGLRHNFRGNLAAGDGEPALGKISSSVMEYLGRPFRFLDRVDSYYDVMAIAYGYTGELPKITDAFCTDENGVNPSRPTASAECNSGDATNDPYSYFERRLAKAIDLLVNRQSPADAPTWTVPDMSREIIAAVSGLDAYATSALATSSGWTNFFGRLDRPNNGADVRAYVVSRLKAQICDATLNDIANAKTDSTAKTLTAGNIDLLRTTVAKLSAVYGIGGTELACR
jgi:hypothetical protein